MNEHLKATLGLDNGPFARGLRGAKGLAMDFSQGLTKIGQIAAAGFFAGMVKKSIDFAATIKDVSDTTGIATDTLQAFRQKASEAAGSTEVADKALEKFTQIIGEAKNGSASAAQSFDDVGISLKDLQVMTNQQIFERVSDELGKIKDPAERARLAVELFGKAGIKLSTSFEGGSAALKDFQEEMKKAGKILDEEAIAKLDDYDARIKRMTNNVQVFGGKAVAFIGGLTEKVGTFLGTLSSQVSLSDLLVPGSVGAQYQKVINAYKSIAELDAEALRSARKKLEDEAALTAQVEQTARAKREQAAADKKLLDLMEERGKLSGERGKMRLEELAGLDISKVRSPKLALDIRRAQLAQKYESQAEQLQKVDPAAAQVARDRADFVKKQMEFLKGDRLQEIDKQIQDFNEKEAAKFELQNRFKGQEGSGIINQQMADMLALSIANAMKPSTIDQKYAQLPDKLQQTLEVTLKENKAFHDAVLNSGLKIQNAP